MKDNINHKVGVDTLFRYFLPLSHIVEYFYDLTFVTWYHHVESRLESRAIFGITQPTLYSQ